MGQYLPLVVLAVLAILFALLSLVASRLLAPSRPSAAKEAPYECGIVPTREMPTRFPVSFYLVAMLFVMFDIEIIFIYPYAVARSELGVYGLVALVLFSAFIFLSFIYEVARGGLDWGPLNVSAPLDGQVSASRTSSSTVRRVGLEGRDLPVGGDRTGTAA